MKNRGFNVDFVNLASDGRVDFDDFASKMSEDTDIVSIMYVNNETGAVNDIVKLVSYAKEVNPKVIFHCDGVQAVGKILVDLDSLDVDMFTMSAHKIHGMKGVGALYLKKDVKVKPLVFGGGQEGGLRSGTENILGIYSLSKAVEISTKKLAQNYQYVSYLKNDFLDGLSSTGLVYSVHSDTECSPYIMSLSFKGCRAETILNMMNDKGFYIGNGSACSSKKSGNRVLEDMGISKENIEGNLRISFSKYNSLQDVAFLVEALKNVVSEYLNKVK